MWWLKEQGSSLENKPIECKKESLFSLNDLPNIIWGVLMSISLIVWWKWAMNELGKYENVIKDLETKRGTIIVKE